MEHDWGSALFLNDTRKVRTLQQWGGGRQSTNTKKTLEYFNSEISLVMHPEILGNNRF